MTIRPIVIAPDRRLKVKCKPVGTVDDGVRQIMDDMLETMYAAPGIGLAAPQIGLDRRIIVLDVAREGQPPAPMALADPEILWHSPDEVVFNEGCLSLPDIYLDIARPAAVKVRYRDRENRVLTVDADGILARCLQHEIDHLDGVLHVDHVSALKRNMILRKLEKQRRGGG